MKWNFHQEILPEQRELEKQLLFYDGVLIGIFANGDKKWFGTIIEVKEHDIERWLFVNINKDEMQHIIEEYAKSDTTTDTGYLTWEMALNDIIVRPKKDVEIIDYAPPDGNILKAWSVKFEDIPKELFAEDDAVIKVIEL
jgi:hypothetical protein